MNRKATHQIRGAKGAPRSSLPASVRDEIDTLTGRLCGAHAVVLLAENCLAESTDSEAVPALAVALREMRAVIDGMSRVAEASFLRTDGVPK